MVLSARGDATCSLPALAKLCEIYWYPLYAFVRKQGHSPHEAQDLTQEFFARLLERNWLDRVTPERGRFRSFLLASMKHFLANEWDRAQTLKRGGGIVFQSLDEGSAEARFRKEPAEQVTAEQLYDQRWALTLLDQVLARLRKEMADAGKIEQFEALKFCLTGDAPKYAEAARALQINEGAAKVAAHRLRRRYRTLIRDEIAQTVASSAEVDAELKHLFAALS